MSHNVAKHQGLHFYLEVAFRLGSSLFVKVKKIFRQ